MTTERGAASDGESVGRVMGGADSYAIAIVTDATRG